MLVAQPGGALGGGLLGAGLGGGLGGGLLGGSGGAALGGPGGLGLGLALKPIALAPPLALAAGPQQGAGGAWAGYGVGEEEEE